MARTSWQYLAMIILTVWEICFPGVGEDDQRDRGRVIEQCKNNMLLARDWMRTYYMIAWYHPYINLYQTYCESYWKRSSVNPQHRESNLSARLLCFFANVYPAGPWPSGWKLFEKWTAQGSMENSDTKLRFLMENRPLPYSTGWGHCWWEWVWSGQLF